MLSNQYQSSEILISPQSTILISSLGTSPTFVSNFSISSKYSYPFINLPKTTCFPSSHAIYLKNKII